MLAGFGDALSAMTRLPAVKDEYPAYKTKFWLGGFGKSPIFSKEQLEREGYEAGLIKNLTYHNQLPSIRDFLMSKVVKEGDKLEDWSFCSEIFANRKPIFSKYDLQYPCTLYTSDAADDLPCVDLGGRRIIKKKK